MRFLRENLFLLILIAAVAILGGMLTAVNFSVAGEVRKRVLDRQGVARELRSLAGGDKYNRAVVEAEKQRVATVRLEANRIIQAQIEQNRSANPPLTLRVTDPSATRKVLPAFPIDPKEYHNFGLTQIFMKEHRAATEEAFRRLKPTAPPTETDIAVETQRQRELRRKEAAAAALTRPAEANYLTGEPVRPDPAVSQDFSVEAAQRALDFCVHLRASKGHVYVDNPVLQEVTFGLSETQSDEIGLWRKQYKLWIARGVIDAVKKTNDDVLSKLPEGERNVLNAPVKRWTSLRISEEYARDPNITGQAPTSPYSPSYMPPAMPPRPSPTEMPVTEEYYGRPVMPRYAPTPVTPQPAQQQSADVSVTRIYSSTQSDVIVYEFAVVMSNRGLQSLVNNLQDGRLHTVQRVTAAPLPRDEAEKLYYYGNDSVLLVTLWCQAQLLTNWERDLMPLTFLQKLPESARREEDNRRIQPAAPPVQPY